MEWFTGVIEDISDPKFMNRVRVRCFGIHTENLSKIPMVSLPWSSVMMPTTAAGVSGLTQSPHGLLRGSWVIGFFRDGKSMQDPIVMGSVASQFIKAADPSVGFNDPTSEYPKKTHLNEPDVNRLARKQDKATDIPTLKKNSLKKGVTKSVGGTWDEPESKYAPVYPFNKVHESESGHITEMDDTKGVERLHEYHRTGTFREVHPDGTIVTRIVQDNYEIVSGDDFVSVKGNVHLTIDQNCTTYIKGNWDIKVDKNMSIVVGGTLKETVTGAVSETYSSTLSTKVSGAVSEQFGSQSTAGGSSVRITASQVSIN
jgi:hypothetical protein